MTTDWVLVVHHFDEQAELIENAVKRVLATARIVRAGDVQTARKRLAQNGLGNCRLIAAGIRVPLAPGSSLALDGADLTTLQLVGWARRQSRSERPPALLLAAFADPGRASEVSRLKNAEIVPITLDVETDLAQAAARLLSNAARPAGTVDIDIELRKEGYRWRALAAQPPLEAAGPLDIRRSHIDLLRRLSSSRTAVDADHLSAVGEMIYERVMSTNADDNCTRLSELLDEYCGGNDGLKRARIRFIVDEHTYPILLESVAQPRPEGDGALFWMLEAPIFRRYDVQAERAPLFKDPDSRRKKLNCLLIQGDVSGFNAAPPLSRPFVAIDAARDEVLEIEDFLRENDAAFRIGKVKSIRHAGGPHATPTFLEELATELRRTTWDLIHYAGHCFGQANDDGDHIYLVFGPGAGGVVEAATFARWVRRSRFLFLSTCQSAGAHFVLQMVKQTVPAIVGYRWAIDDLHARQFAKQFYASLFGDTVRNRYIEYAFLQAKRALHDSKLPAPAWAAPMLVMQSLQRDAS